MKVAMIARSTFFSAPGGDTVQAVQTARNLTDLGIETDVRLSNETIVYEDYDLLHFFNLIRPADILYHSKKAGKPFVVSTILCNYSEYDKFHRKGAGKLFSILPADGIEYLKTMARWLLRKDHLSGKSYIWKGQRRSIIEILKGAAMILPNSESEYQRVKKTYAEKANYLIVPNGVNPALFQYDSSIKKDLRLILCVARIEGLKNQLNLIKALNNTPYKLLIIGSHSPNQAAYYRQCREIASENVSFIDHISQEALVKYYQKAKVHILPSWFETTGLSSIEGALMGCNIVITDKGDAKEYFGDDAFYCDPGEPENILAAIEKAIAADINEGLRQKILEKYTWQHAALQTQKSYQLAINQ
ncbi:glycosyltransferase family 4 protein [Pedobacter sp. L105]|uniref:glycosyltransferase family 4 protein n=1 Tax=Pedobacter sp. L105 TaxID=1641871 RepID=UPI00131C1DFD|nr:glycosyltransferase family 4 protein [Pedobacter sp. L105]